MKYTNELKNIKIYKRYSIFNNLIILGPIITLFFIAKGLSFTEIFIVNSVSALTTILFEVPTGAIGDRISRKSSLIIGSVLVCMSLLIYIVAPSFSFILIGEVVFAIGVTFRSGTEQALLYDSLKNNNMEKEFSAIIGVARSNMFYAQGIGSIFAGLIYVKSMYLPFYFSAFFMLVAGFIAMKFEEPHIDRDSHNVKKQFTHIKESFYYAYRHPRIFSVILFSVIFILFSRIGFNYYQPYMEAVHVPTAMFGFVFFLFNMIAAYASKHATWFLNHTKPRSLMVLSFLIVISFIGLGLTHVWVGIVFFGFQQLARGYRAPVFQKYINKRIPSDKRATIISIQSFSHAIVVAVLGPAAGYLLDHTSIFTSHLVIGILMSGAIVVANLYMLKAGRDIELTQMEK